MVIRALEIPLPEYRGDQQWLQMEIMLLIDEIENKVFRTIYKKDSLFEHRHQYLWLLSMNVCTIIGTSFLFGVMENYSYQPIKQIQYVNVV